LCHSAPAASVMYELIILILFLLIVLRQNYLK